ncbi:MAG: hypothetical protein E6Q97_32350 [Desulfurellales bacterium]|nr:MAG: hypothetical protein E6Q97_32350 [Desulfurellales bacterium]
MTHLEIIAIMGLVALGVWAAMGEGMVLSIFRKGVEEMFQPLVAKPLATCPRCMVTIYGTGAVLLLGYTFDPWMWPVYICGAVGLQEMLHR